jgi:hypothetical protein
MLRVPNPDTHPSDAAADISHSGLHSVKFYSAKRDKQGEIESSWVKKVQVRLRASSIILGASESIPPE